MGTADREAHEIHGRVVYFGPTGAGKSANLRFIQRKLKREHRGELKKKIAKDGATTYDVLPVSLGAVRGYKTSIEISTVPGSPQAAALRRELLKDVDGIVFVADLRPERHDATLASAAELRQHLSAQGRKIEDVPLVLQYNRRDQVDENAVERLHRKLGIKGACFEAVASEGTGVLQTLTTLSKLVLAELRKAVDEVSRATPARAQRAVTSVDPLEPPTGTNALTARVKPAVAAEKGFTIESAGPVDGEGSEITIPLRLVDEASGRRVEIAVRIAIDS
ncbi:MAG TPA: GTPase domain-containing protein [Myxococcota bacterium]|nr:GTPase domain-containing protein [Myxococcota bacterium]